MTQCTVSDGVFVRCNQNDASNEGARSRLDRGMNGGTMRGHDASRRSPRAGAPSPLYVEGSDNYGPERRRRGSGGSLPQFPSEPMIDEKIKIKCTKCLMMFRERGQRIRPGYQMQCPHCLKLLTFDSSSGDNNIRRALESAMSVDGRGPPGCARSRSGRFTSVEAVVRSEPSIHPIASSGFKKAAVAQSSALPLLGPAEPSMHRIPVCQRAAVRLVADRRANAAHLRMMTARGLPRTGMRCVSPIAFFGAKHCGRLRVFDLDPVPRRTCLVSAVPTL